MGAQDLPSCRGVALNDEGFQRKFLVQAAKEIIYPLPDLDLLRMRIEEENTQADCSLSAIRESIILSS